MSTYISTVITAAAMIIVAVIETRATIREKRSRERSELQTQLLIAQMEVSRAQSEACTLLLKHAHGEHLNGNVEACIKRLEAAEAAQDKIRDRIVAA